MSETESEHTGGRHRITETRPQSGGNSGMYDPGQQSHSSGKKLPPAARGQRGRRDIANDIRKNLKGYG